MDAQKGKDVIHKKIICSFLKHREKVVVSWFECLNVGLGSAGLKE